MSELGSTSTTALQLQKRLFHMANRRIRREEDARDLAQDVWLALPNYKGRGKLRNFMSSVFRRQVVDHYRQNARKRPYEVDRPNFGEGKVPMSTTSLDTQLSQRLRTRALHEAIEQVPDPLKEVLRLELDGLSAREIAKHLGISCNTVRSRQYRGRKALRPLLEALLDEYA